MKGEGDKQTDSRSGSERVGDKKGKKTSPDSRGIYIRLGVLP
jgi:hypothetical protein